MKVLVYGETVRQARNGYVAKVGETVGHRVYAEYDNGEEYDDRIVLDKDKIKAKKAKKENGV